MPRLQGRAGQRVGTHLEVLLPTSSAHAVYAFSELYDRDTAGTARAVQAVAASMREGALLVVADPRACGAQG